MAINPVIQPTEGYSPIGSFANSFLKGMNTSIEMQKAAADLKYTQEQREWMKKQSEMVPPGQGGGAPETIPTPGGAGAGGGTGGGGGGSGGGGAGSDTGDWGAPAQDAINTLKQNGWSDAAVQGAMANGLAEGGFGQTWKQSGIPGESSYGHWQFNDNGELPNYMDWAQKNNVKDIHSTSAQAQYVANRMDQIDPNYKNIQDPKQATDLFGTKFERYKGAGEGQRYNQLAQAQKFMSGQPAGPTAAAVTPPASTPAVTPAPATTPASFTPATPFSAIGQQGPMGGPSGLAPVRTPGPPAYPQQTAALATPVAFSQPQPQMALNQPVQATPLQALNMPLGSNAGLFNA
jgi:hypothetical protein